MGYWHSRGLHGSYLESLINTTNQLYLEHELAVVQKLPTAITPVELDKQKGTIKLAYFDAKSTVDYMGNVQGDSRLLRRQRNQPQESAALQYPRPPNRIYGRLSKTRRTGFSHRAL